MKRREFLSVSGVAAASLTLGACAPARHVLQSARGQNAGIRAPFPVAGDLWRSLSRITYAPRSDELGRAQELGQDAWIQEQLAPEQLDDLDCDLRIRGIDTIGMDPDFVLNVRQESVKQDLQRAALLRAIYSRRQLEQVMVEFWTDHFNIAQDKLDCAWLKVVDDREVIRRHAFGNFYDMLWASMHSPAMLHYLDNHENFRESPNENYARELLELHALGVDAGYTQRDVRETARGLTGWTVNHSWRRGRFEFDGTVHDPDEKMVLGIRIPADGGEADGQRIFDTLCAHPAMPRLIGRKLVRRFVADDPPAALVERTAQAFRESCGEIKAILRVILFADEFKHAPPKYKRPLDLVAGTLRQLDAETNGKNSVLDALAHMGQPLFQWAMPDGFPDRANAWQNNLLPRWQFAVALANDQLAGTTIDWDALAQVAGDGSLGDALRNVSALLLGVELPDHAIEAVAGKVGDVSHTDAVRIALGILVASPQHQWK